MGVPPLRHFRPLLVTALACLAVFTLSRAAIVIWHFDRLAASGTDFLPYIFVQGLRFDIVSIGVLLGVPALLTPLFSINRKLASAWPVIVKVYCLLVFGFVVFMEMSTPSFINEFDLKPDRRFIEYLVYPREVFGLLWSAYKLQLFATFSAVIVAVAVLLRLLRPAGPKPAPLAPWTPLLLVPLVFLVLLAAIRSTTDHRPVNPSTVVYTTDPLANQFPLNSSYTVLYALSELQLEEKSFAYRKVPPAEAFARVRQQMRLPESDFVATDSTLHRQQATRKVAKPINIVIVLEESLGADYVSYFGGLPLTPELDALHDQGIWFEQMYATGSRSVRGIEATVAGFPPTTARSVVKLPRAQRDFFTIASLLETKGYSTAFIYGGEPQFDNMGRFFANNGFQKIVGRHDFGDDVFDGDWGASDEDMFNLADRYFRQRPAGQPFFGLLFTTSNHTPFDYPAGRIEPYNSPAATLENAVKYADHALGDFIRKARQSNYWDNTIFLIIADHSDRVYGDELVPIHLFHIPAVIVGGPVQPRVINRVASQIDMLPTLLSLAAIDSIHPAIGIDQTRTDLGNFPGRAVMQYAGTQAYMLGHRVAILQKGKPTETWDYLNGKLGPAANDPELNTQATAFANWPYQVYRNQGYRLPETLARN